MKDMRHVPLYVFLSIAAVAIFWPGGDCKASPNPTKDFRQGYSKIKIMPNCTEGYKFLITQTATQFKTIQVMGEDGKPALCGDRLKRANEALRLKIEADLKHWKALGIIK